LSVTGIGLLLNTRMDICGAKKEVGSSCGSAKDIFKTGKAASVISLEDLADKKGLYAIRPIKA